MVLSVQYLRGLAAFMVLLEHVGLKSSQYSGNVLSSWHVGGAGVDLFFLISGFIMCHTTAEKHQTAGASRQFFWRRITRIIPLYWLVTCLALIVYLIMPGQVNSTSGGTDLIASYFLLPSEQSYLVANGWTLRYEFLFYAIFMLGLWFSRGLGNVVVIGLLVFAAGFGFLQPQSGVWAKFVTDQLLLEFACGMLLYHYAQYATRLPMMLLMSMVGVGLGALLAVNQGVQTGIRVVDFGLPMLLIMGGALGLEKELQQRPVNFLKSLGDSSYAMYLIHPFALAGGAMVLGKLGLSHVLGGWLFVSVLLVGSVVAGYLLYQFVEKPMTRFLHKRPVATDLKQQNA